MFVTIDNPKLDLFDRVIDRHHILLGKLIHIVVYHIFHYCFSMMRVEFQYHFGTSLPTLKRSSGLAETPFWNFGFFDFATIDL
jgi:hypothetical protein